METEYISIKDFAEKAGVSQQSLYKRLNKLNNQLNNYVKMVENQKMIDIRALQEVYGVEVEQPIQPIIQPVEQPIQPIIQPVEQPIQPLLQATIESLSKELERKSEELQAKDKQYADLKASMEEQLKSKDRQIADYSERLKEANFNLSNEQRLRLEEHEEKRQLQEKLSLLEVKEPVDPMQEVVEPDEPPTEQKGFWAKLFKK